MNLPFADDEEFGRLHAAIRIVLPILPALSASSPIADGRPTGMLDTRLDVYRTIVGASPRSPGMSCPSRCSAKRIIAQEILNAAVRRNRAARSRRHLAARMVERPRGDCPLRAQHDRDSRAGYSRVPGGGPGHLRSGGRHVAGPGRGTFLQPGRAAARGPPSPWRRSCTRRFAMASKQ